MLTDEQILEVIKKAREAKLPEWRVKYQENICRNLQVHTKGLLFSKVDTVFPNESPDSKAHCVNTYEPITKGSIEKAVNNISRVFLNSSYNISASINTLDFINNDLFNDHNIFTFFIEMWMDTVISTDPNSFVACYPEEGLTESRERIRAVKSEHVRMHSREMIVFVSEEESKKSYSFDDSIVKSEVFADARVKAGINSRSIVEKTYNQKIKVKIIRPVYHVFTKEFFMRFWEDDNSVVQYEVHNFKKPLSLIPAFKLTGVRLQGEISESFVAPFIPFGNLALLQHRNHRAVDLMFSYPRLSEIQTPCDNLLCNDGLCDSPDGETTCGRCGGSGFVTVQSPYKVYQKRIDTGLNDPETIKQLLAADPVAFHTPEVAILTYSKDSWKDYLNLAEEAVFVQQKQRTGNVESFKAKEIDLEAQYSWIKKIHKAFTRDLRQAVKVFEEYLNVLPNDVTIEQPLSVAVVTETEAFEALDIIIKSEAPVFVKAQQVENFVSKFVSQSSPIIKSLSVLKLIDPLLFYSNTDVQTFKSNNAVSQQAWTTHIFAYPVLLKLYEQDDALFEKEDSEIVELVRAEIDIMGAGLQNDLKARVKKQVESIPE